MSDPNSSSVGFLVGLVLLVGVMGGVFMFGRALKEEPKCPPSGTNIVAPSPATSAAPSVSFNFSEWKRAPEYTTGRMYKKGDVVDIKATAFGCSDNPDGSNCTVHPGGKLTVTETVDRRSRAACQYVRSTSDNAGECKTGVVACDLDWVHRTMNMKRDEDADLKRIFNK